MDTLEAKLFDYLADQILVLLADLKKWGDDQDQLLTRADLIPRFRRIPPKVNAQADYQFNICSLHRFKVIEEYKKKERNLVEKWARSFKLDPQLVVGVTIGQGPFLNFQVNQGRFIHGILDDVLASPGGEKYGQEAERGQGKTVLVEYSSPNIAKPFHMGHLRSTILGNFLKNLYQNMGYQTIGINYLGDWGKQYGLLAIAYERWGDQERLEADPIGHLYELYVRVNKELEREECEAVEKGLNLKDYRVSLDLEALTYFQKLEAGDLSNLELWSRLKKLSLESYEKMYQRLGVSFDVYSGESLVSRQGPDRQYLDQVFQELQTGGWLEKDEKGTFVDLEKIYPGLGHAVILKSDETTMYLTRDLAEAYRRWQKWQFTECLYVVGNPQQYHFKQFFHLLGLLEGEQKSNQDKENQVKKLPASHCRHIGFGQVLGMSSRKGKAVFLSEILDRAQEKMLQVMKENQEKFKQIADPTRTADLLGMSAVIIQDLSAHRNDDYRFDWDRMLTFKGETGPYLQYAHARIASMIRKVCSCEQVAGAGASDSENERVTLNPLADLDLLTEPEAFVLVKLIGMYPGILRKCFAELEAVYLVEYLMDLAKGIAVAHGSLWVLKQPQPIAEARLLMFWCAKVVLAKGLRMLGLTPVEAM